MTSELRNILNKIPVSYAVRSALHTGSDSADWKRVARKLGTLNIPQARHMTEDFISNRAAWSPNPPDAAGLFLEDLKGMGVSPAALVWALHSCGLGDAADKLDGGTGRPIAPPHPGLDQIYGKVVQGSIEAHQQLIKALKLSQRYKQFLAFIRPSCSNIRVEDDFQLAVQEGPTEFANQLLAADTSVGVIAGGLVHIGQIEVANKLRALVGAPPVVLPQNF